jgi:integrase/recombinase XerD
MAARKRKAPAGCYWRGNNLWGRVTVSGRKVRWSLETDDTAVAKARREAGRERLVADKHGDAVRSFAEVYTAWDQQIESAVGSKTADRYRCSLAQIAPWLDGKTLPEVNGRLVAEIVRGRQVAGVSNATIKRDLGALSSVMKFCVLQDWREENPVLAKLALAPERRDPIVLPLDRDIKLVASRASPGVASMILAAVKTGAREDELLRATRDAINHDRKQMTIVGKRNKLRVIDLEPFEAHDFLAALPAYVGGKWLFWHGEGQPFSGKAFPGKFYRLVKKTAAWAEKEGLEFQPFTFHHLRHKHAVDYLKEGCGTIYDLQGRLGHTSVKTTEMYLAYLTSAEAQVAKFGRAGAQKGTQQAADEARQAAK